MTKILSASGSQLGFVELLPSAMVLAFVSRPIRQPIPTQSQAVEPHWWEQILGGPFSLYFLLHKVLALS